MRERKKERERKRNNTPVEDNNLCASLHIACVSFKQRKKKRKVRVRNKKKKKKRYLLFCERREDPE